MDFFYCQAILRHRQPFNALFSLLSRYVYVFMVFAHKNSIPPMLNQYFENNEIVLTSATVLLLMKTRLLMTFYRWFAVHLVNGNSYWMFWWNFNAIKSIEFMTILQFYQRSKSNELCWIYQSHWCVLPFIFNNSFKGKLCLLRYAFNRINSNFYDYYGTKC